MPKHRDFTPKACPSLRWLALLLAVLPCAVAFAGTGYHADCTTCHGRGANALPGAADDRDVTCTGCHTGLAGGHSALQREGMNEERGGCLACHDPHEGFGPHDLRAVPASEGPANLDAGSRLCIDCHDGHAGARAGSGNHPVGIPVMRRPPSGGEPVLVLPLADIAQTEDSSDDVIGCTTCHDVHASSHRHLLRWSQENVVQGCSSCHRERAPAGRTRPVEASLIGE